MRCVERRLQQKGVMSFVRVHCNMHCINTCSLKTSDNIGLFFRVKTKIRVDTKDQELLIVLGTFLEELLDRFDAYLFTGIKTDSIGLTSVTQNASRISCLDAACNFETYLALDTKPRSPCLVAPLFALVAQWHQGAQRSCAKSFLLAPNHNQGEAHHNSPHR